MYGISESVKRLTGIRASTVSEVTHGAVVLISNDLPMRKLLSAIINEPGYSNCSLVSIEAGMTWTHVSGTVLIVIDTCQPVEEALRTLARLGDAKMLSTLPVIILTSHQFETQPPQVKSLATVDVLIKPFTASTLRDHLEKYLIAGEGE